MKGSRFNLAKDFSHEENRALMRYHQEKLERNEGLANVMMKRGIKGRVYIVARVLASRHARRLKQLRSVEEDITNASEF